MGIPLADVCGLSVCLSVLFVTLWFNFNKNRPTMMCFHQTVAQTL